VDDRLGEEFWTAFWTTKRAMKEAADAAYRRHGVRDGQQFILRCLWEEDGLAPGQVARRLALATPTVTKMASRMEAAGLLARVPHPSDGRLVRLCLTDRGRALKAAIDEESARLTARALKTLDAGEQAQVVRFLNEIRRNISDP
jgi:DNA-binding MarR family transcriptional regulator